MVDKEYEGWHNRVSKEIDPSKGVRDELNRVFSGDENQPTSKQVEITRDYHASSTRDEKVKLRSKGKTYVKTDENKFRSVETNKDVMYNPNNDTLYILDDKGRIKGKVD